MRRARLLAFGTFACLGIVAQEFMQASVILRARVTPVTDVLADGHNVQVRVAHVDALHHSFDQSLKVQQDR